MHYDPVKDILAKLVRRTPFLRRIFYRLLGIMFLREWYVKRLIKVLYKKSTPSAIFDAGSGFGQYSYFMTRKFPSARILGLDVKEDQVEDCNYFFGRSGLNNCKFLVGDLTRSEYRDEFDLVLSVDVMEHIEDDLGVLKKFHSSLKPGGRVIINTPSNLGGSDAEPGSEESFIGEHVRTGYSRNDICGKLESAGFSVESFEYTYGKWGNLYWRLAIKYPMLMLGWSKFFFLLLPFYYLFTIWWSILFMWLDTTQKGKLSGTGILVVGVKVISNSS